MGSTMRLAAVLACLLASPALADEQSWPINEYGLIEFNLPSGNISCTYVPAEGTPVYQPVGGMPELTCTRLEPVYTIAILRPVGAIEVIENPGEQGCCGVAPVLDYGDHWRMPPFTCLAAVNGLTCVRGDGHGFTMARSGVGKF